MAVDSLSVNGYSHYIANSGTTLADRAKPKNGNLCVDPLTGNVASYDTSLYDPNRKVKKDYTKENIIVGGTAAAATALYLLSRGKIKGAPFKGITTWIKGVWTNKIKPFGTKIVNWFKNLFKRGGKDINPPGPANNTPQLLLEGPKNKPQLLLEGPKNKPQLLLEGPKQKPQLLLEGPKQKPLLLLEGPKTNNAVAHVVETPAVKVTPTVTRTKVTPEELKAIDIKHVRNSHNRQMVQNALDDVVTEADMIAYRQAHRYQAPTVEQAAAIRANNATANRASAISRQIQNNIDDASLAALQRARMNLTA